jgi:c-di-GMP-binding flagellar brake protein YcgR
MEYNGAERREFIRIDYKSPLTYKVCREETLNKLLEGYIADISQSGLLCNIRDKVNENDILWLSFDKPTLNIFEDIEKRSLIYQSGIIGKVVRIEEKQDNTYDIGVQFLTREEKNLTNIYSKFHFTSNKIQEENNTDA